MFPIGKLTNELKVLGIILMLLILFGFKLLKTPNIEGMESLVMVIPSRPSNGELKLPSNAIQVSLKFGNKYGFGKNLFKKELDFLFIKILNTDLASRVSIN
jgi:hypothetical protein